MLRSRVFLSFAMRRFLSRLILIMNISFDLLIVDISLKEETNPNYDLRRFCLAQIEKFIQKYQILSKLDWGTSSIV